MPDNGHIPPSRKRTIKPKPKPTKPVKPTKPEDE